jgi:hypothetical protein
VFIAQNQVFAVEVSHGRCLLKADMMPCAALADAAVLEKEGVIRFG